MNSPISWAFVAALFGLLCYPLGKLVHQVVTVRIPADRFRRYVVEIEARGHAVIRAHLHVAECECELTEYLGKVPQEFAASAFLAARIGYGIERAVISEAKRRGVYSPDVLDDLANPEPLPGQRAPAVEVASPVFAGGTAFAPPTTWVGDRLVPAQMQRSGV